MLVISRKEGESIIISTPDGEVRVAIKAIHSGGQIKLWIEAPDVVELVREELINTQ